MTATDVQLESDKRMSQHSLEEKKSADVRVSGCSRKQESSVAEGCLAATELLSAHH